NSIHACVLFLFFNDPSTPQIYTLSLHDALPIFNRIPVSSWRNGLKKYIQMLGLKKYDAYNDLGNTNVGLATYNTELLKQSKCFQDRKSTRLNSSHVKISYAVFCLKKKTK